MRNIDDEFRTLIHMEVSARRQGGEEDSIILKEVLEYVETIIIDYIEDPDNDL